MRIAAAVAIAVVVLAAAAPARASDAPPAPARSADDALKALLDGNRAFVASGASCARQSAARRAEVAGTQHPIAVIVGCADSRVPPEVIYDEGLGVLFTVRVAGNTAQDPLVVGSIEFAILNLGSVVVVVLGHEECGAVKAAIDVETQGTLLPGDLPAVVAPILGVVRSLAGTPENELLDAAIKANVRQTVAQLSANTFIADAIAQGTVKVVGREYLLKSGEVVPTV
jgi:carbonic anhydrase